MRSSAGHQRLVTPNVRTEAIEATLEEIRKDTPKAALAKAGDFVDLRFVNELKQSGYLDRIWK